MQYQLMLQKHFVLKYKWPYRRDIGAIVGSYLIISRWDTITFIHANRTFVQISKYTGPISHNASFCDRNVHMCAQFCYRIAHCVIFVCCIVGLVRYVSNVANGGVNTRFAVLFRETSSGISWKSLPMEKHISISTVEPNSEKHFFS